jgi:hypothetical protein
MHTLDITNWFTVKTEPYCDVAYTIKESTDGITFTSNTGGKSMTGVTLSMDTENGRPQSKFYVEASNIHGNLAYQEVTFQVCGTETTSVVAGEFTQVFAKGTGS